MTVKTLSHLLCSSCCHHQKSGVHKFSVDGTSSGKPSPTRIGKS